MAKKPPADALQRYQTGKSGGVYSGGDGLYGGGAPPAYTPTGSSSNSERSIFLRFIKAHPGMEKYNLPTLIWNAVGRYGGMTATQLAAVIWAESKGNPSAANASGALGLGQILDNVAGSANAAGVPFFRADHNISEADKRNPAFAVQYMAWRIGGYISANGGSIDDAWRNGYGGDQPGGYISKYLPKGYIGTGGASAADAAGKSNDVSTVKQNLTDPYVVGVSSSGKIRVAPDSGVAPKNVILYDGTPMRVSDWQQLRRGLDQYFVSYTGGRPDNKNLLKYVQKGWSPYSLTVALAKGKDFKKSPIWKSQAPQYQEAARDLLPQGQKAPEGLIRSAILNNWTSGAFQAVLRAQPGYITSNEFESNTATLMNVHSSIMGVPDNKGLNGIKQAALAGWSPDQYAAYLRSSEAYSQSPEYQTKVLSFLDQLGLITGQQPVLKKGTAAPAPMPSVGAKLPNDPRIKGQSGLTPAEDTVATYGK